MIEGHGNMEERFWDHFKALEIQKSSKNTIAIETRTHLSEYER